MPETNEGILFIVGAVFFLIGLIGGGIEISAIKIPAIGRLPRFLVFGVGALLMGVATLRLLAPAVAFAPTPTPEFTPVPAAADTASPTDTLEPSTPTTIPTAIILPTSTMPAAARASAGRINNIWVDYDVVQLGRTGLLIHVEFQVDGLENVPCAIGAYFYTEAGERLNDQNGEYASEGNQVISYQNFTPVYPSAQFDDFELFLPYDELDLPDGDYDLKFLISIWDMAVVEEVVSSPYYSFTYSQH